MSRIKHASPALVISTLALVAAVVVPAVAQVAVTALTKKEKRVVRKIANGQITKRAPGLAVASAKSAADTAEVHTPARIVMNDPTPGDLVGATATVLGAGAFTISAECRDNSGGSGSDLADLQVHGPTGSSFSGMRSDSTLINAFNNAFVGFAFAVGSGNQVRAAHVVAVAPNGQVVWLTASAEVGDPAGDCVFGVTAIGP